jgi:AcrR family transcriptional regulator
MAERASYHHGNLQAALIEVGIRRAQTQSAAEIGLRDIARELGVSAMAVYRHFPSKQAYLQALACEGVRLMGEEQAAAAQRFAHANDQFAEAGRAYVRFALKHPGLFRLIFASGLDNPVDAQMDASAQDTHNQSPQDAHSAGVLLVSFVRTLLGKGAPDVEVRVVAYRAWSLVHGLAMLMLDKQIDQAEGMALLERIVSTEIEIAGRAMTKASQAARAHR